MKWVEVDDDVPARRYEMKFTWMKTYASSFWFHNRGRISLRY
jgi:hypothetical protein